MTTKRPGSDTSWVSRAPLAPIGFFVTWHRMVCPARSICSMRGHLPAGRLEVVAVEADVAPVEHGVLGGADVHEGRFHARQDVLDPPPVDVPVDLGGVVGRPRTPGARPGSGPRARRSGWRGAARGHTSGSAPPGGPDVPAHCAGGTAPRGLGPVLVLVGDPRRRSSLRFGGGGRRSRPAAAGPLPWGRRAAPRPHRRLAAGLRRRPGGPGRFGAAGRRRPRHGGRRRAGVTDPGSLGPAGREGTRRATAPLSASAPPGPASARPRRRGEPSGPDPPDDGRRRRRRRVRARSRTAAEAAGVSSLLPPGPGAPDGRVVRRRWSRLVGLAGRRLGRPCRRRASAPAGAPAPEASDIRGCRLVQAPAAGPRAPPPAGRRSYRT